MRRSCDAAPNSARWLRRSLCRHPRDERGFTLVELLVTCAILPIVGGAIAAALISIVSLQGKTASQLSDSADAQVLSTNFEQDVHSSQEISTASTPQCGPASQTQLLGLEWGPSTSSTVVSYDRVTVGATTSLIRNLCSAGAATIPTSSTTITHGISPTQPVPTITPATSATAALTGWTPASGVATIAFNITAPASSYTYSLVSTPQASASSGQLSSVATTTSSCGFATPGTGYYATTLCFVDFSSFNPALAQSSSQSSPYCPSGGQKFSAGIASTPYSLNFCLKVSPAASYTQSQMDSSSNSVNQQNGHTNCALASLHGAPYYGSVCPVSLPSYYSPTYGSEAFLGNNGFYTGIPGSPGLIQTQDGGTATADVTLSFTNIQVLDSNGSAAQNWQLITGDAESTDSNEFLVWSTCSSVTVPVPPSIATCASSSSVDFSLFPDTNISSQAAAIGNACPYGSAISGTAYTKTFLTGVPASGSPGGNTVECAASSSSNKTGTVMLEAPTPTTLTITLGENAVGDGIQAVFVGILLP